MGCSLPDAAPFGSRPLDGVGDALTVRAANAEVGQRTERARYADEPRPALSFAWSGHARDGVGDLG